MDERVPWSHRTGGGEGPCRERAGQPTAPYWSRRESGTTTDVTPHTRPECSSLSPVDVVATTPALPALALTPDLVERRGRGAGQAFLRLTEDAASRRRTVAEQAAHVVSGE